MKNTVPFPNALSRAIFYNKYSRWNDQAERRETKSETINRSFNFLESRFESRGGLWLPGERDQVLTRMHNLESLPSMRLLWSAGKAAARNNIMLYNCLGGDTDVLTRQGLIPIKDAVGPAEVLDHLGEWRPVNITSHGSQTTYEIEFGRHKSRQVVRATIDHQWLLTNGNRVSTADLKPGDKIASNYAPRLVDEQSIDYRLGVMHGIIYGDGTATQKRGFGYMIRLCGRSRELASFFDPSYPICYPPSYGGDPVISLNDGFAKTHQLKELPSGLDSNDYLIGFLRGWIAADGYVSARGQVLICVGSNEETWLRRVGPTVGFNFGYRTILPSETNFGTRGKDSRNLEITRQSLVSEDLLLGYKRERFLANPVSSKAYRVVQVRLDSGIEEETFCTEVSGTHTFTLGGGLITGNCSFMAVNRLEAFPEALFILMSGTGVGYSVEGEYVDALPRIKKQKPGAPIVHVIADSTEGWADALREGIQTWWTGGDVVFDASQVRPEGARLITKGGRASGPGPLLNAMQSIRSLILGRQGRNATPLLAHDIMCLLAQVVVVGGIRRSSLISLGDLDDMPMRGAKQGEFWRATPWRSMANNSVAYDSKPSVEEFLDEWTSLIKGKSGERGMFNRAAFRATSPRRKKYGATGTNPCGEINLRDQQFCNLSEIVCRPDDDRYALAEKIRVATILGTIQASFTDFPYISDKWRENCVEEALLGVSATGQMDCPAFRDADVQRYLKGVAIEVNKDFAYRIDISQSAAITCTKPSGTASILVNASSGQHTRWSKYYIRRIRLNANDPMLSMFRDMGMHISPDPVTPGTFVVDFPTKSPEGSITRHDLNAMEQLAHWHQIKTNFTEHNPSATIYVKDHEWLAVGNWIYENWDVIGGLSFLPSDDHVYPLAPHEEIDEAAYLRLMETFPVIDDESFAKALATYEIDDMTTGATEFACSSGQCEII